MANRHASCRPVPSCRTLPLSATLLHGVHSMQVATSFRRSDPVVKHPHLCFECHHVSCVVWYRRTIDNQFNSIHCPRTYALEAPQLNEALVIAWNQNLLCPISIQVTNDWCSRRPGAVRHLGARKCRGPARASLLPSSGLRLQQVHTFVAVSGHHNPGLAEGWIRCHTSPMCGASLTRGESNRLPRGGLTGPWDTDKESRRQGRPLPGGG